MKDCLVPATHLQAGTGLCGETTKRVDAVPGRGVPLLGGQLQGSQPRHLVLSQVSVLGQPSQLLQNRCPQLCVRLNESMNVSMYVVSLYIM